MKPVPIIAVTTTTRVRHKTYTHSQRLAVWRGFRLQWAASMAWPVAGDHVPICDWGVW